MRTTDLCAQLRLYVVIDPQSCQAHPVTVCQQALEGGATAIQLRSKRSSDRETLDLAAAMRAATNVHQALFFINDRVDLAMASEADGVHLGVDDLPISNARSIAGEAFIIGYSPETDIQATAASENGANYLGIGPVFATATKPDAGPAIGLGTLRRRSVISGLPVVGIGGIATENAGQVVAAGACGVAVMSAIISSASPVEATRQILSSLASEPVHPR